ncbi:MAG: AMP-binding protein [Beijerinckiaceae bacterium]|nr:AMP-binding protein [Beijerinckiaceae bacterium]
MVDLPLLAPGPSSTASSWTLPEMFNIGHACADSPAERSPGRTAIIDIAADGTPSRIDFQTLSDRSSRLAAALKQRGVGRGDRIAILLPQGRNVAIAHLAGYKLGAIAVPLAQGFQADALDYRLRDAGARVLITNAEGVAKIARLHRACPLADLDFIVSTDGGMSGAPALPVLDFRAMAEDTPLHGFAPEATHCDDPALMIYTSGTTGQPKGALHGQRVLIGHLPGFQYSHQPFDDDGALFWTPSDWAWAGGLLNVLLPALYFGRTVMAWPFTKFDPNTAFRLLAEHQVSHVFIPPTALRMMRAAAEGRVLLPHLKRLASAGEALGAETYHWARDALGLHVDEFYGQTECNYVLGSSFNRGVSKAGAIGKAIPGARVLILDADGNPSRPGEQGQIAVRSDHPAMFLQYWGLPEATAAKFRDGWMLTGDLGVMGADGYISFVGRDDDIITSAGYRIGPVEIEDCLLKHPAIALAAVIGKPDPLRTEIVKAFVVLKPGFDASAALKGDIQAFVRERLSVYEYPREIEFAASLPMTTTGKIMRRVLRDATS